MRKSFITKERERKRAEAETRQKVYNALTLEEKLARLDSRPGNSQRERDRLNK
jgi:hypothetical protein